MPNDNYKIGENKATTQQGFRSKENVGKTIRQLALYCKKYLPAICLAVVLAILGVVMNILGPGKLSEVIDVITDGMNTEFNMNAIISIMIFLTVIYCAGFLFSLLQGIIMATITQKTSNSLHTDISVKIN